MTAIPAGVIAAAQSGEAASGVPASITLAQWALESGWGQHMPARSNNPFGIKARMGDRFVTCPTREVVKGAPLTVMANFRAFASLADAFAAHGELLAGNRCYAPAMKALPDIGGFARALNGVYATDPHYAATLMEIIDGHKLTQYDRPALA